MGYTPKAASKFPRELSRDRRIPCALLCACLLACYEIMTSFFPERFMSSPWTLHEPLSFLWRWSDTCYDPTQWHVPVENRFWQMVYTVATEPQRIVLKEVHRPIIDVPFPRNVKPPNATFTKPSGHEEPWMFYPRPLRWPEEAYEALEAYKGLPDFKKLLTTPPIPQFEVVVNLTQFPAYPFGSLVVTSADEYGRLAKRAHKPFADDMVDLVKQLPRRYHSKLFITRLRDYWHPMPFPILTKARAVNDPYGILVPLKYKKHFVHYFTDLPPDPTPFRNKESRVVWRGIDSGTLYLHGVTDDRYFRRKLVMQWADWPSDRIDIAFGGGSSFNPSNHSRWWAQALSVEEQRRARYLVSAEGNDVATGLKWMLESNSVVIMPHPTREIWTLEGQLKAWVHYVPVRRDYRDLWDRAMLCERHMDECEAISRRATEFIRWFKDHRRNRRLAISRIKEYLDRVTVTVIT